jgi:hypothetical protein
MVYKPLKDRTLRDDLPKLLTKEELNNEIGCARRRA